MRLGKTAVKHDPRTLKYATYRTGVASAPWRQAHWGHGLSYEMLGNDYYGDCVEARYAHQIQVWSVRAGIAYTRIATGTVLDAYSAITGFSENDPNSDQGTNMLDAENYWRKTGMAGYKIDAYAKVNPQSQTEVMESVAWFGGLNIGLALPKTAQDQVGSVWDVTGGPGSAAGSWGGHCVPVVGYTSRMLWLVTWGALQAMTWDFLRTYCDEAYVELSKQWIEATGTSPSRLAWGQLEADLANL